MLRKDYHGYVIKIIFKTKNCVESFKRQVSITRIVKNVCKTDFEQGHVL